MSLATADERASETRLWMLAAIFAAVPLSGFWLYGLFDLDEGFYAAVVSEMLRTGDWLIPRYAGEPWLEKPILLYWLAAPCVAVFGEAIGPRLPSVLAMLGLYASASIWVANRFGESAGRWTLLILGTTPLLAGIGRMMMADALLVALFSGALLAFLGSLDSPSPWRAVSGGLLGLAVLAKGPVALALFAAILLWTYLAEPELRPRVRRGWMGFVLAFAMAVGIWAVPACIAAGDVFVREFLWEQNVLRFLGGDEAHRVAWWMSLFYYPLTVLVLGAPWSWLAIPALPMRKDRIGEMATDPNEVCGRFLGRWFWVVLVFFSISGSKLPHYVAPALVPIALFAAIRLGTRANDGGRRILPVAPVALSVALAAVLNLGFVWYYDASGQREAHELARYVRAKDGVLTAYRMNKPSPGAPVGGLRVRETSLPSLVFYFGKPVPEADSPAEVQVHGPSEWLIARKGAIDAAERRRFLERDLVLTRSPEMIAKRFELFRMEPLRLRGLPRDEVVDVPALGGSE